MGDCTVAKPVADAEIVVVPGENVEAKFADANVSPCKMVIEGSTAPMLVDEEERLMDVSCRARAGFPEES